MASQRSTPLPTGTVTFLFTDIEGSTRLLQSLGDRYAAVLEAHTELLRTAIGHHRGIEVNTEGDAIFAVFTAAPDALAAAADAQLALSDHAWPANAAVRVRMGVHSGIGQLGGQDYVGIDVHRAARIAAAAHGGQILVSATTRALAEGALPDGVEVRDLGLHRLKDLDEPERLYQLSVHGLPGEFPRPRSLEIPVSLPPTLTTFVGRDADIERVWAALGGARLVTLTGPGGSGKSRLAIEVARRHSGAFADGVHFVALEALADPALVPSAIVQALGLREGSRPAATILAEHLASRQALLILDNVEQLRPAAPAVVSLLGSAPGLRMIATSRVPLGIGGEQEIPVDPLSLPPEDAADDLDVLTRSEAVRLFVDRAKAASPSFALEAGNARAVAGICARLDGLPLAVELAAARVKLLPPETILTMLADHVDLLTARSPTSHARQQSLRATIEWSWELLAVPERHLLERLSVFAGGWDLAAADAICDPAALGLDVVEGLASLLDQSLVRRVDSRDPRFAMLLTIQAFGRERLTARGEADEVARRHAAHFRDAAQAVEPSLVGADPAAAVERLARDEDNLRAALDWAERTDDAEVGLRLADSLWRYWQVRGQLREGRRWLERLLAMPSAQGSTELRAHGLTALGGILYWQGDPAAADAYRDALTLWRALDDARGIADALQNLAFTVMSANLDEGRQHFRESLARYRELGDDRNIASVVGALGYAELMSGRLREAHVALEEALALNSALGIRGRANDNRTALGHVQRMSGDLEGARVYYRDALADTRATGDAARMLMQLEAIQTWASAAGRHRDAVRLSGAFERARGVQGGSISIPIPGRVDAVAAARGVLDEGEMAAARAQGLGLELAGAVEAALAMLADPEPPADPALRPADRA